MSSGKSFFPVSCDRDEPNLPLKDAEDVYTGSEGTPETTILHNPTNYMKTSLNISDGVPH